MKRYVLIVGHVTPSFSFACHELRIEAPCNDRVDYDIVCAVNVHSFRNNKKLSVAAGYSGSAFLISLHSPCLVLSWHTFEEQSAPPLLALAVPHRQY